MVGAGGDPVIGQGQGAQRCVRVSAGRDQGCGGGLCGAALDLFAHGIPERVYHLKGLAMRAGSFL